MTTMKLHITIGVIGSLALVSSAACGAGESSTGSDGTYNVAWFSDNSGPYADVWPGITQAEEAVTAWWNDEVGSELGVTIEGKEYDTRYDTGQVASLWPGVLSELQPVMVLGVGGPDVAALEQRLPDDEVPMFMSTAAYGYAWKPDPWVFNPRPTYAHEAAAFLQWYKEENNLDTLRFGSISSQDSPAYVELVTGVEKWAEETDGFDFVGVEWAEVEPANLTTNVRTLLQEDPDVILTQTNTAAALLTVKALKAQGADDVVTMVSSHNSLTASGQAAGDLCEFDGMYESFAMEIPAEESGAAYDFYKMLTEDYGLEEEWSVPTVQGLGQALYSLRIFEQAVDEVGAENVTGSDLRAAAMEAEVSQDEMFGMLSDLSFSSEAPFPLEGMTVNIGTVEDCEYAVAARDVPVPEVPQF